MREKKEFKIQRTVKDAKSYLESSYKNVLLVLYENYLALDEKRKNESIDNPECPALHQSR
jgi:hypothetical protein